MSANTTFRYFIDLRLFKSSDILKFEQGDEKNSINIHMKDGRNFIFWYSNRGRWTLKCVKGAIVRKKEELECND